MSLLFSGKDWDNSQVIEALRSKEPVTHPQPVFQLLDEAKRLERWEVELLIDALQEHLDD